MSNLDDSHQVQTPRFADYFFVTGLSPDTVLADKLVSDASLFSPQPRDRGQEASPPISTTGRTAAETNTNMTQNTETPSSPRLSSGELRRLSLPEIISLSSELLPAFAKAEETAAAPASAPPPPILTEQQSDLLDGNIPI
jgi:hypothetical protein